VPPDLVAGYLPDPLWPAERGCPSRRPPCHARRKALPHRVRIRPAVSPTLSCADRMTPRWYPSRHPPAKTAGTWALSPQ